MSATMLQVAEGLLALPGAKHLPHTYKDPISNLPTLPEAQVSDISIPIIDLEALHGPRRSDIVKQLGQACQHRGFFAVGAFFFFFFFLKIFLLEFRLDASCAKWYMVVLVFHEWKESFS